MTVLTTSHGDDPEGVGSGGEVVVSYAFGRLTSQIPTSYSRMDVLPRISARLPDVLTLWTIQ